MKTILKAIADGANEYKEEMIFNKAVNEIKTLINDGKTLLEAAKRGEYSYTVVLPAKTQLKLEDKFKTEIGGLGLDCSIFCSYGLIACVTITWD